MIEFLSAWAKSIGLAIIIISILEMLLPNNKTKKYVRMVFGIYIIFNIISPFIKNKDILDVSTYDFHEYSNYITNQSSMNESSMDSRIEQIYIEELEKDITKKVNDLGYNVTTCNVYATLSSDNEENYIEEIVLTVEKSEKQQNEEETIEDTLVNEIQKIKPINTTIEEVDKNIDEQDDKQNINNRDVQKIKKFLKEEYGVEETCLKIN
mgnify:CR=1 FL=1